MGMMMAELYDALTSAGADEKKARAAATAVATWEDRFTRLEGKVNLLQWMVGFNLALTTAILWRIFS